MPLDETKAWPARRFLHQPSLEPVCRNKRVNDRRGDEESERAAFPSARRLYMNYSLKHCKGSILTCVLWTLRWNSVFSQCRVIRNRGFLIVKSMAEFANTHAGQSISRTHRSTTSCNHEVLDQYFFCDGLRNALLDDFPEFGHDHDRAPNYRSTKASR